MLPRVSVNLIRIRLSTGALRHIHANDRDQDWGIGRLMNGEPPFAHLWVETTEGPIVNRAQIVEAYPHIADAIPSSISED